MNDTELLKKIHAQVKNHRKKNLSNQLVSEILDHKFDDFSASTGKRVVELEVYKINALSRLTTSTEYIDKQELRIAELEKQNAELHQNLGLMTISFEQKKSLLESCETALEERDDQNAELRKERDKEMLKKECGFRRESLLLDRVVELERKTFRNYNNEEYWIFQDDGDDYPDSIICPVVMSADQFRRLIRLELNLQSHNLEQKIEALKEALAYSHEGSGTDRVYMIKQCLLKLQIQAKALKDGK